MNTADWIEKDKQFHINTYARRPVVFAKAAGTKMWDIDGREYTDFLSGIGVLSLGHCHPAVVDAFCSQARELGHISNLFYARPQIELAEKLGALGGGKCFFANSGAEANEGALKLARRWGKSTFSREKTGYVSTLKSFHGRTMATLAATGQPEKNRLFEPLPPGHKYAPFNDIAGLAEAVDDETCAVILEAVQGESGVQPAEPDYLRAARRLCDERRVLLIIDEVQSGTGRTGKFFAFEHYGIEPDIITLAKGLGGGFPIGAVLARDEVAAAFGPGDHGSTFGGGPPVCAAALAVIKTIEDDRLIERAADIGAYFKGALSVVAAETGLIANVRGLGLMLGITLGAPIAGQAAAALLEKGFIVNNVGDDILRFLPPLIIEPSEIDALLAALREVLETVNA